MQICAEQILKMCPFDSMWYADESLRQIKVLKVLKTLKPNLKDL